MKRSNETALVTFAFGAVAFLLVVGGPPLLVSKLFPESWSDVVFYVLGVPWWIFLALMAYAMKKGNTRR